MENRILVIDIGTQSLRATIVSDKNEILALSKKHYETPYISPEPGFAEQDANYYIDKLCQATNEMEDSTPGILNTITGMVLVSIRDSSVMLDENNNPIGNAILWLDQRITRQGSMPQFHFYEKIAFRLIGMTDSVRFNAERSPANWLKINKIEDWKKMKHFVTLSAYFNYRITSNLAISKADFVGHYAGNCKKGILNPKSSFRHRLFGIPYDCNPTLVDVGSIIGRVTQQFSKLSKIPVGIPLYAAGTDKCCETFGNGCIDKNSASISLGTACSIDIVDQVYKEPEAFLPSYPVPYKNGGWDEEVQVYRGLWMISWFSENFGKIDALEAKQEGISLEQHLENVIKSVSPGCDGLVLQPYWGPGLKRPNAKGSIVGFSGVHTRYHLYRAMLEGIGFALREGMECIMKKTHKKPERIVISGGGSKSELFCQIFADIFNIPVYQSIEAESTTIGAAMSCFLSMGVFKDPKQAISIMVKDGKKFLPNSENNKIYEKLYNDVYLKMYPSLKHLYNNCKNFYLDSKEK